ncbi:hypothetical protein HY947_02240 [Candidatus Gottesmanbacteria bacterium]|nr:hypothetical protein [Candidatus Gottesmanbacteria bacterium]
MITLSVLLFELTSLFFIGRALTMASILFFSSFFRSRTIAVTLITLFQFPGTIIHELAHLFTAEILGVRTGKLILAPESIRGDHIQTGSVQMNESDPFRRALIGIAPLLVGLVALGALSSFLPGIYETIPWNRGLDVLASGSLYILFGLAYLLSAVSLAMFPSSIDMKGVWGVGILITLILFGTFFLGLRVSLTGQALEYTTRIGTSMTQSLGLTLALNSILLLLMKVLVAGMGKISSKRR